MTVWHFGSKWLPLEGRSNCLVNISLHLSMYRTQSSKCCCDHCRLRLPKEICVHLQSAYQNIIQPRTNHYWSSPFHSIKWFVHRYVYIHIILILYVYCMLYRKIAMLHAYPPHCWTDPPRGPRSHFGSPCEQRPPMAL